MNLYDKSVLEKRLKEVKGVGGEREGEGGRVGDETGRGVKSGKRNRDRDDHHIKQHFYV